MITIENPFTQEQSTPDWIDEPLQKHLELLFSAILSNNSGIVLAKKKSTGEMVPLLCVIARGKNNKVSTLAMAEMISSTSDYEPPPGARIGTQEDIQAIVEFAKSQIQPENNESQTN